MTQTAPLSSSSGSRRARLWTILALAAILALGAGLRFYQLGVWGVGNSYYAAAVKSMLTSWHNFFFVSFEPGGSVSVDKPPLGLWLQAASAALLGVNGFALALPQALAGVLSIAVLYDLVRRPFGRAAGLLAALVLAVAPVTVAAERNNTMDGTLVLALLLAAWAVMRSVRTGRLRWLLAGAALVGVGFNIKMLQAYMVLPALGLVYLACAPHRLVKRLLHLIPAGLVLAAVSLAWVVAVDLTPASARPYVGSSSNNSVWELVIGHNGLRRLGLSDAALVSNGADANNAPSGLPAGGRPPAGAPGDRPGFANRPAGGPPAMNAGQPQGGPGDAGGDGPGGGLGGGPGGPNEVGSAGLLRLFTQPLDEEAGWLLPAALAGLFLTAGALFFRREGGERLAALLLWGGWLLPMMAYFSLTTGLWHAYYLIMLGPALGALVAAGAWALASLSRRAAWAAFTLAGLATAGTLVSQYAIFQRYPAAALPVLAAGGGLALAGLGLATASRGRPRLAALAGGLLALSLLAAPFTFAVMTAANLHPNTALPNAGPGGEAFGTPGGQQDGLSANQRIVLDYLLAHTSTDQALAAAFDSHVAAPYILATGRAMPTLGGFTGSDPAVTLDQLRAMIDRGALRYVLVDGQMRNPSEIGRWVTNTCRAVDLPGGQTQSTLYDCAAQAS